MNNSVETVLPLIRVICGQEAQPDGLVFDAASIEGRVIKEDADYEGVRIVLQCSLENARIQLQIDIGFGYAVVPEPNLTDYPIILDLPAPRLLGYRRETVVAEKFEAMVKLGQLNSRMKDFYDVWTLAQQFEFEGSVLCQAVNATFKRRQTTIPSVAPLALTREFAADVNKQAQWRAFLNRSRLTTPGVDLSGVIRLLDQFLSPPMQSLSAGKNFKEYWLPHGPWRPMA
jgi:hypothetical protein